jgi:chaperonin GroES
MFGGPVPGHLPTRQQIPTIRDDILMREAPMKIRPLNDRLLIQRLEEEDTSAGGIIIPDSAKEKQAWGKVIAAGPGKVDDSGARVKLQVKKGDVVLFSKYGGTDVTLDGREYLIMREDDILGIVEK